MQPFRLPSGCLAAGLVQDLVQIVGAQRQIAEFKDMLSDAEGATRTREAQTVSREARIVSALGDAIRRGCFQLR